MRAFITCDGEAKQIEVFQEEDVIQLFKDALIDFGKTPASCSAICQSSDASPFFKAAKKRLKFVCSDENNAKVDWKKTPIGMDLKEVLAHHPNISDAMQSKIIEGLQLITVTILDTLNPSVIKKGYELIGQYPINFNKAMKWCTKQMSIAEMQTMEERMGDMVAMFRTKGCVTETDMDELGIINVNPPNSVAKHNRALHQQRAVIMNSEDCIAKFKVYKTQKELEKEQKEARKAVAAAKKIEVEARKAVAAEKKAANALKRQENAERKARYDAMTKEERQAENRRRREERAQAQNR